MTDSKNTKTTPLYRVFDEMACDVILLTDDPKEAHNVAYNYQSVLIDNHTGKVITDYSC